MPRPSLLPSATGTARALGEALADLLYPPLCLGCADRLPVHDPAALPVCGPCRRRLPPPPPDALPARLARLEGASEAFGHALALWTFDAGGVLQRLQHALKYGDRPGLGVAAGWLLAEAWRRAGYPLPDRVVPIPLARPRRLERGYNQSERLAEGLRQGLGVPVAEALTRVRATRKQTTLSREHRRGNVAGAFGLAEEADLPSGGRVLLVDDVLTTGATLLAAAEPLRRAGLAVDLAALALTRE
jgi:ComF family protein